MDAKDKTKEGAANRPVGYGNPPLATRFQPGKSGNPAGRPKGYGLFKEALRIAALEETANEEHMGKKRKGPALQLLLHDRFRSALNGNHKAAAQVLSLARLLDDDAGA